MRGLTLGVLIAGSMLGSSCMGETAGIAKPVLRVGLGQTPEEVQGKSTVQIPWSLSTAGDGQAGWAFVKIAHTLRYSDKNLELEIQDAGNDVSMATGLAVQSGRIAQIGVSALPEYATLRDALNRAEDLKAEIGQKGFAYSSSNPTRFLLASSNPYATPRPPDAVESAADAEAAFLNSSWYVEELVIFELFKNDTRVALRIKNMRRRFSERGPVRERAQREIRTMAIEDLRAEKTYYLDLTITRPFEAR